MADINDISGQRFGRLIVLRLIERTRSATRWECRCDCGAITVTAASRLKSGKTQSCGCLRAELTSERRKIHGLSAHGTYKSWVQILQRCTNPKDKRWSQYGGRGITIAPQWLDFSAFVRDMGIKPQGCSIDRIDNNGNYEPGNCRWASQQTQQNNRSNNHLLTAMGQTMTIAEWSRHSGIQWNTLWARIRAGWSAELAVSTKPRRWGR